MTALLALFGWKDGVGQLVPAGSFANLHGLLLARHAKLPEWDEKGPTALTRAPRIYTSATSHFSVVRGARVAGFGNDNVVAIPVRGRGAIDVERLESQIEADRERHTPIAVVATMGTTATGAIDPFDAIADLCAAHGLWLHVDACYGGGLLILPELAHYARGIGRADSIAIDPHKQWYMPIACGAVLTRHPDVERAAFAPSDASYIPSSDGGPPDAYLRGVATSRRATALGIWLALRTYGWNGLRDRVRRNVTLIRRLERALAAAGFEVLPDGELSTACARWPGADALQEAIAERAVASGSTWFATARHDGRTWLRFALVNCTADEVSIDVVTDAVIAAARETTSAATPVSAPVARRP
jgi:glutamate/tyrosine decarboxylase-like PLP-dependent enzyme